MTIRDGAPGLDDAADPLTRYLAGGGTATLALMTLLVRHGSVVAAERAIARGEREAWESERGLRWGHLRCELARRRTACERAVRTLARVDRVLARIDAPGAADPLAACREAFDAAVAESPEASVALCSLGDPALLAAGTQEIVEWLLARGVVGPGRRVVGIGCGTGRLEAALAPLVAHVHGIDISPAMIGAARARCRALSNVRLDVGSGRDLTPVPSGSADLIYAVDSMPYLVRCGMPLVATHFREAARVLRGGGPGAERGADRGAGGPGGDLVILNFSYRGQPALDAADVRALARDTGFAVRLAGAQPFALWDARAYHLRLATAQMSSGGEPDRPT